MYTNIMPLSIQNNSTINQQKYIEDGFEKVFEHVDNVEKILGDRIDNVEKTLGDRINNVETVLGDRIDAFRNEVNGKFDSISTQLVLLTKITNKIVDKL